MKHLQISPFLLLLIFSYAIIEGSFNPLWFLLFSLIHELGHWCANRFLGGKIDRFSSGGYGFGLQINGLSYSQELMVAAAGPLINLTLAGIFFLFGMQFFTLANLSLAILNLLPILPLDGGRILRAALAKNLPSHYYQRILQWVGYLFLFPLLAIAFRQFLNSGYNVSLLIICFYLLSLLKENGNDV